MHAPHHPQVVSSAGFFTANVLAGERQKSIIEKFGVRLFFKFCRSSSGHNFTVIHDGNAGSDSIGFIHLMSGEKNGRVISFIELLKAIPQKRPRLSIEASGWFI